MHLKEFVAEEKMSLFLYVCVWLCVCEPFLIVFECVIRARMRERAGTSFHILNSLTRQLRVKRVGNYFN